MTQGDPLAIITYDIGILQIIHELRDVNPQFKQPWYADDTGAGGHLAALRATGGLDGVPPPAWKIPRSDQEHLGNLEKGLTAGRGILQGDGDSSCHRKPLIMRLD